MTASATLHRLASRAGDLALTAAAVVGALCLLLTVLGLLAEVRPLVFRSGSMSPHIPTGSLALAREVPAHRVVVGDVVSVPYDDTRVTHRVVSVQDDGAGVTLRLKGDANTHPDPRPHQVVSVDRVWFSVPVLGRVVAWLSRPPGIFVLAGAAAVLLAVVLRRGGGGPAGRPDPDRRAGTTGPTSPAPRARGRGLRRVGALVVLLACGTGVGAVPSWAAWTDTVSVSGTTVSSHRVPSPTLACGAVNASSVHFTWTAVPGATDYVLTAGGTSYTTAHAHHTVSTPVDQPATATVVARTRYPSTTWASAASNSRSYSLGSGNHCS